MLDLAARLALRGAGYVEPNPMVGCLLVRDGRVIGWGHHRKFGGPHAEREALADCRGRGEDPRGATVYVTLEPCSHFGKTPPCTGALIEAGVARVVAARRDPNPISAGGAAVLERAGIGVEFCDASRLALAVSEPFIKRVTTGLPWVIAKWAQFEDGRMVTRPGEPRWISNEWARRRVHRLRGRVDAIVTGIGTVLADDPMLTVRGVRASRVPTRVVLDSRLEMPVQSGIARSARDVPTMICTTSHGFGIEEHRMADLTALDVPILAMSDHRGRVDLRAVLRNLTANGAANVLVEAGPRVLASFFEERLVDEAVVHVALRAPGPPSTDTERAPALGGLVEWRRRRVGNTEERLCRRSAPRHGDEPG
jgi:diaminohydroxyphosphoribosylaminopyrimidine deaminase/5-amino-6-(5-phosphoribosylamino)uracil reductase